MIVPLGTVGPKGSLHLPRGPGHTAPRNGGSMVAHSLPARARVPSSTLSELSSQVLSGILSDGETLRQVASDCGLDPEKLAAQSAVGFALALEYVLEQRRLKEVQEQNARRDELDQEWLAVTVGQALTGSSSERVSPAWWESPRLQRWTWRRYLAGMAPAG